MTKCDLVQPEDLARRHALTAEVLSKYSKGIKTIRLASAPRPTQTPPPSPFSLLRVPVTRASQAASPVLAPAHKPPSALFAARTGSPAVRRARSSRGTPQLSAGERQASAYTGAGLAEVVGDLYQLSNKPSANGSSGLAAGGGGG